MLPLVSLVSLVLVSLNVAVVRRIRPSYPVLFVAAVVVWKRKKTKRKNLPRSFLAVLLPDYLGANIFYKYQSIQRVHLVVVVLLYPML